MTRFGRCDVTPGGDPMRVRRELDRMLAVDPARGLALAFELLAGEPRIKPSRRLVIDPGDEVYARWRCRVAAAAALLSSSALHGVFDEVVAELAENPELAGDALADASVVDDLSPADRALLQSLRA